MKTERIFSARNAVIGFCYKTFLKKAFFLMDPEIVHDQMTICGRLLGRFAFLRSLTSLALNYRNENYLSQAICGVSFRNPVGLAAGFDKEAVLTDILPAVGFGYEEAGSVTGRPCAGNPKPRLWRLQRSQGLVVYYGLKNSGCEEITARLKAKKTAIPLGISIAKTNDAAAATDEQGIEDYKKAYKAFVLAGIGDYFTVNISCPNAYGGEPFTEAGKLDRLLAALRDIPSPKPMFLKMPADLDFGAVDEIIEVARKYRIAGFVCSNLTKDRSSPCIKEDGLPENGGISGRPMQVLSDELIRYVYRQTKGEFVIIGCGGIFSAEDAYRKIRLGASLVQLITGMIFEGPQLISSINSGLVKLLRRDGFGNISEAVGVDNK